MGACVPRRITNAIKRSRGSGFYERTARAPGDSSCGPAGRFTRRKCISGPFRVYEDSKTAVVYRVTTIIMLYVHGVLSAGKIRCKSNVYKSILADSWENAYPIAACPLLHWLVFYIKRFGFYQFTLYRYQVNSFEKMSARRFVKGRVILFEHSALNIYRALKLQRGRTSTILPALARKQLNYKFFFTPACYIITRFIIAVCD